MYQDYEIISEFGLHMRNDTLAIKLANKHKVQPEFEALDGAQEGSRVSGTSLMGILNLDRSLGTKVRIYVEGESANQYLHDISDPELVYDEIHGVRCQTFETIPKASNIPASITNPDHQYQF